MNDLELLKYLDEWIEKHNEFLIEWENDKEKIEGQKEAEEGIKINRIRLIKLKEAVLKKIEGEYKQYKDD